MQLQLIDFAAISPLLILLTGALLILLIAAFSSREKQFSSYTAILTIFLSLLAAINSPVSENQLLTSWLAIDSLARCFTLLFLLIGIGTFLLSASFFKLEATKGASCGEYYFLLLSCLIGLLIIGSSADFLTLFLGIETLSISLYILCSYMKQWKVSHEAGVKYFLMGALAAAFLLYGIALIYGALGTTKLDALLSGYRALESSTDKILFLSGITFVSFGLAFKAAIVPFHFWAPDVYDGAPTPVTAFMALGTKAGAFAAFTILFLKSLPQFNLLWNEAISILSYATLIYANFVALRQVQLRRFFAYSGIAHSGYLLIPIVVGTEEAIGALLFYLVIYILATLGAFSAIVFLDKKSNGVMLEDLHGLFQNKPFLATIFSLCLLTLAGIPPTAGFFAKFYLFKLAFESGYYALVIVALLTAILAAFYYVRIIAIMLKEPYEEKEQRKRSRSTELVASFSLLGIIFLTVYPTPLIDFLRNLKF